MVTTLMIGTLTMEEANVLRPLKPEGYIIPLKCVQGLIYMDIRPFTDGEAEKLPIVHLARDQDMIIRH